MKIALYVYYVFRSVLLRGLFNSIRLLRDEVKYEKQFGVMTAAIKKSESTEFFHYQGASYRVLMRVFSDLYPLTKACEFVDIGCGKGRAVFVAEYCGYNKLTGIELDKELIDDARENAGRYLFKRTDSDLHFVHVNALDFEYNNTPTLYFLFNPFNASILGKVLDKITVSSQSETWFVYMNPLYVKPFQERGINQVKAYTTRFYTEALVFKLEKKMP